MYPLDEFRKNSKPIYGFYKHKPRMFDNVNVVTVVKITDQEA